MRDPNRIPEMIQILEEFWKANPDYRLGQLITVATRPTTPHPGTYAIEDDEMLDGLKSIGKPRPRNDTSIPYWEKYPQVSKIEVDKISFQLIEEYIQVLIKDKFDGIITATKLMELNGAPTDDRYWMAKQRSRILRLRELLCQIQENKLIKQEEIGYVIDYKASA